MRLDIQFRGDVVERQELLNGTETVTIDGSSVDSASGDGWTIVCSFSWNLGILEHPSEGDLTLSDGMGNELFCSLATTRVRETDLGHAFDLGFEIDGGAGRFADAAGEVALAGTLTGDEFASTLHAEIREIS